jgi:hypothetical protein
VWKDPRNCLLLPYWRRLLAEPVVAIFIWRSPLSVAASLQRRDGLSLTHGLALWEHYNRRALEVMVGLPVYVTGNQALLDDPLGVCTDIAGWLDEVGISPGASGRWQVENAGDVIAPFLSRHRTDDLSDLAPAQLDLIERLHSLDGPHRELEPIEIGPMSRWAVDMLDTERRFIRLARGNQDLSTAHNRLIVSHGELNSVSGERLEHLVKVQELADQRSALIERLKGEIENLEGQIASVEQQCEQLAADRDEWKGRARRADETLEQLSSSISWRVTAPLRAIRSVVKDEKEDPSE